MAEKRLTPSQAVDVIEDCVRRKYRRYYMSVPDEWQRIAAHEIYQELEGRFPEAHKEGKEEKWE